MIINIYKQHISYFLQKDPGKSLSLFVTLLILQLNTLVIFSDDISLKTEFLSPQLVLEQIEKPLPS
ncbi:MAG: hypothetical protein Q8898_06885, partial [Bacillota bacterium]|nr:hypothetical protein [Bacillota bacterium]